MKLALTLLIATLFGFTPISAEVSRARVEELRALVRQSVVADHGEWSEVAIRFHQKGLMSREELSWVNGNPDPTVHSWPNQEKLEVVQTNNLVSNRIAIHFRTEAQKKGRLILLNDWSDGIYSLRFEDVDGGWWFEDELATGVSVSSDTLLNDPVAALKELQEKLPSAVTVVDMAPEHRFDRTRVRHLVEFLEQEHIREAVEVLGRFDNLIRAIKARTHE